MIPKKLVAPKNALVDPVKMELTFDFTVAKKHGIQIHNPKGAVVVNTEFEHGQAEGKIKIDLIKLKHLRLYAPGRYSATLTGLKTKDDEVMSEPASISFELTGEQAALANSKLNGKTIIDLQAAFEKFEKECGSKLKLFPDLDKAINDLKKLFKDGGAGLDEIEALKKQLKTALAEAGTIKNEHSAALRELNEAVEKAGKIKPAKQAATGKTGAKSVFSQSGGFALLLIGILFVFIIVLAAVVQHGPIAETKALFPNGVNNAVQPTPIQPAVVAPPPATPPAATNVTSTVQPPAVLPPVSDTVNNTIPSTVNGSPVNQPTSLNNAGERVIQLPYLGPGQNQAVLCGRIKPNEIVVFYKPDSSYKMTVYYNNEVKGKWLGPYGERTGWKGWLISPDEGAQPVHIVVTKPY